LDPAVDFFAGTVAGVAALIVGHPFDTVKVRFQNPATAGKYRSTFHAMGTIIRDEGPLGLFKGLSSPLASAPLLNGLLFASYGFLMKLQLRYEEQSPNLSQVFLAGAGCGLLSASITTPIELIKIQQQKSLLPIMRHAALNSRTPRQPSARRVALRIYREHGIPGLYRGVTATGLRDVGYGFYFLAYEASMKFFSREAPGASKDADASRHVYVPWWGLLLSGGFAGVSSWVMTFPFDVVKTRMQSSFNGAIDSPSPSSLRALADPRPYRNTLSTIVNSYRAEGAKVFFHGLSPTVIRAIPVNMVTFATFEAVVAMCS
ncbi:mitochondrial carrier domain-containing protein, partial [Vararia minispora EC-137]